jgi:hypothetical protein
MIAAPATAGQLARIEATRLVRNPAVWLGVVLGGVMVGRAEAANELHFLLIGYGVLLPGLVMLVASAFAVRRDRSSGATELMATTPTDHRTRTAGHGFAGLVGGGGLALTVTAAMWLYRARDATLGPAEDTIPMNVIVPRPNVAQFLQGPLAVVALCALGVLIGRWLPSWLVVVVVVIPAMIQFLMLGLWNGSGTRAANWLFPLSGGWVVGDWIGGCTETSPCHLPLQGFDRTTPWWHLGYLVALTAVLVVTAMLGARRDRSTVVAWLVAAGAVIAFAAIQSVVYTPFASVGG